jgi:hypothetical protein
MMIHKNKKEDKMKARVYAENIDWDKERLLGIPGAKYSGTIVYSIGICGKAQFAVENETAEEIERKIANFATCLR